MKDDLNFKAVLLRLINNNKPQKQMVLTPQRFFGMQPYFDPTRKTTSQKNRKQLKKNKNRRQPQKNIMEDDNCKAVLLRLFNNNKPQKQMVQRPQRFFARQP